MSFNTPYKQHSFMGIHATEAAALVFIRAMKWDSTKDGLGTAEEGMTFFDSTLHVHKSYQNGSWEILADRDWTTTLVTSGVNWREVLLSVEQLINGASGGIAPSILFNVSGGLPAVDDKIYIKNGAVTETYTVKAAKAVPFEVAQGADFDAFMTNLAAEITLSSAVWKAIRASDLDRFFAAAPTNQVLISNKAATATSSETSRLYGTLTAPAVGTVVEFVTKGFDNYDLASATEAALAAADPTTRTFGFGRAFASLVSGETHNVLDTDAGYTWDVTSRIWNRTIAVSYTRSELNSTTGGSEGALLIGTDAKANLGAATTVEAALTDLNTKNPPARSSGAGSPYGIVAGAIGDLYVDTTNDVEYVNTDGTVNGWVVSGMFDPGSVAVIQIIQSGQPGAGNLLTIGADVYEADGAGANINFVIGGSAAATMANLLAEAVAHGTEHLFWDSPDATHLRLRSADAPQGNIIADDPNILVTCALANYDVDAGNVNMNTLAGRVQSVGQTSTAELALTADMVAAGEIRLSFPKAVQDYVVVYYNAAGVLKLPGTDTVAINNGDLLFTLNGGVGDLVATDVISVIVSL